MKLRFSRLDGAGERFRGLEGTVRDMERKMGEGEGGDGEVAGVGWDLYLMTE